MGCATIVFNSSPVIVSLSGARRRLAARSLAASREYTDAIVLFIDEAAYFAIDFACRLFAIITGGFGLRGLEKQGAAIPLEADLSKLLAHAIRLHHALGDVRGF